MKLFHLYLSALRYNTIAAPTDQTSGCHEARPLIFPENWTLLEHNLQDLRDGEKPNLQRSA